MDVTNMCCPLFEDINHLCDHSIQVKEMANEANLGRKFPCTQNKSANSFDFNSYLFVYQHFFSYI